MNQDQERMLVHLLQETRAHTGLLQAEVSLLRQRITLLEKELSIMQQYQAEGWTT